MTREEVIRRIKAWNLDADDMEVLSEVIPELKKSEEKEKPNGGIVLENFNEGDGFYKVNLAYLSKEQVEEIENIVKKWKPKLKESEDERIRKELIELISCMHDADPRKKCWIAYLEKQKDSVSNAKYIEDVAHAFEDGRKKGIEEKQKEQKQCIYGDTPSIERCAVCSAWCDIRVREDKQKPEAKLTGWVARDNENNSYFGFGLFLFNEKPERTGDCWSGAITSHLPWKLFPDLKWNDEPMEVEITIRKK